MQLGLGHEPFKGNLRDKVAGSSAAHITMRTAEPGLLDVANIARLSEWWGFVGVDREQGRVVYFSILVDRQRVIGVPL